MGARLSFSAGVAADIGSGRGETHTVARYSACPRGGAVLWATLFGVGGYQLGKLLLQMRGVVGPYVLEPAI